MKAVCPVCGEGHINRETWKADFEYQGQTLAADHTEEFCDACGTLLQSPEVMKENVKNIQRAKLAHDGLLCGEEIKALREYFGITQKVAATLFGGGPTAFAKYESDEIAHNVAMDRLLRLSKEWPDVIGRLAQITNVDLSQKTRSIIHADLLSRWTEISMQAQKDMDSKAEYRPKVSAQCANDSEYQLSAPKMSSWRNKVAA